MITKKVGGLIPLTVSQGQLINSATGIRLSLSTQSSMVRGISNQGNIAQLQPSKEFSTATPMRISALLDDRLGDSLYINGEKGISRILHEDIRT